MASVCQVPILFLTFVIFVLGHLDRRSEQILVALCSLLSTLSGFFVCLLVVIVAEMFVLGPEYLQILLMELLFHRQLYYNTIFIVGHINQP